jgi:quercetin dioxygenase-like cupin family protein
MSMISPTSVTPPFPTDRTAPAAVHVVAAERTRLPVLGQFVTVRIDAAESGGAWALFELECPPGTGTPLHREAADESFVVLDGVLTFTIGAHTIEAGPGDCVVVPAGTPHAEANASDAPARAFALSALGARKVAMFEALAALGREGRAEPARIVAVCSAHGVDVLPPAPASVEAA